jgi:hypothetical protein
VALPHPADTHRHNGAEHTGLTAEAAPCRHCSGAPRARSDVERDRERGSGAGAPAFFSFDQAAVAFFAVEQVRDHNFSGREIVVRQQDRRARIDSVLVQPARVVVRVSGNGLRGASLTLSDPDGATRVLYSQTREARLSCRMRWAAEHGSRCNASAGTPVV